jgi:hypothetical protein
MAGKIIADIIEAPFDSIKMNVANVTVLTANNSGLTYLPTGNVNINIGSTASLTLGNVTVSNLITANGGIKFPATQVASADANTLDDYEEGTWSATDASGAGLTFTSSSGIYVKIGGWVYVSVYIAYPSTANASAAKIGGLPFTSKGGNNANYVGSVGLNNTGRSDFYPFVHIGQPQIFMRNQNNTDLTNANFSTRDFVFQSMYQVA